MAQDLRQGGVARIRRDDLHIQLGEDLLQDEQIFGTIVHGQHFGPGVGRRAGPLAGGIAGGRVGGINSGSSGGRAACRICDGPGGISGGVLSRALQRLLSAGGSRSDLSGGFGQRAPVDTCHGMTPQIRRTRGPALPHGLMQKGGRKFEGRPCLQDHCAKGGCVAPPSPEAFGSYHFVPRLITGSRNVARRHVSRSQSLEFMILRSAAPEATPARGVARGIPRTTVQ